MLEREWAQIRDAAKSDLAAIKAGAPQGDDATRAALELLEGKPLTRDPIAHGAVAALLLGRLRDRLVPFWLTFGGPGFALACAVHERRRIATHAKNAGKIDLRVRWLEPRPDDKMPVALDLPTWETLNGAFRKLKKADLPAAQEEARSVRTGSPVGLALWTSGIALLGREAAEDIRALPATPELEPFIVAALPALAEDPCELTRAVAIDVLEGSPPSILNRLAKHAKDIAALLDEEGAPALVRLLTEAHQDTVVEATAVKKVAEALAAIDTPAVATFFRANIDSRLVGTVAAAWVTKREKNPRAEAVHERALAERGVRSKRAKKAAKKVATRRKREAIVEQAREATLEELPWVLREPPWHHPNAIPPLPERHVDVPFEEKLHLTDADREGIDEAAEVDEDDAVGQLVKHGLAVVPALLRQPITSAIFGLRNVESPRVAVKVIEALATPRKAIAKAYFRAYPKATAVGLMAAALDPKAKRRAALEALAILLAEGFEEEVREAGAAYGDDVTSAVISAAKLVAQTTDAPAEPSWLDLAKLPSLQLPNGARLPPEAATHVLEMCTFGASYPGLREVALDKVSTDAFLVALLDAWVRSKSRTDDWVLPAVAALGGPDATRAIVARAKEWNKERTTRERALEAIQALAEGGTSAIVALGELVRKGGALGERANEVLAIVARREHLSTEELADIAVPTLDLDERGRATLDFGPRSFEIVLGDDLTPIILDGEGHPVKTVRALASDDKSKATASLERLKSLKKSMGEVARGVSSRLELAMILGRTWLASRFFATIVEHPLIGRFARRLVWSAGKGRLFRIAEDGTAADENDDLVELAPRETVRLPHTLDLPDSVQKTWGTILTDYEIIQPFPQIGRPTFTPTETERKDNALSRFAGIETTQMAIQGRLLARGWERIADGGFTSAYVRRFKSITAQYTLVEPLGFGENFVNETKLGSVTFGVPLDRVPPLVFSEVAFDLHVFAESASS